jgi:hypothetical protein
MIILIPLLSFLIPFFSQGDCLFSSSAVVVFKLPIRIGRHALEPHIKTFRRLCSNALTKETLVELQSIEYVKFPHFILSIIICIITSPYYFQPAYPEWRKFGDDLHEAKEVSLRTAEEGYAAGHR